jgi:hypothetical protein
MRQDQWTAFDHLNKFFLPFLLIAWSGAMQNGILQPAGFRTSYLNIDSTMDVQWETSSHNPANISLSLPNSTRTNKIWRIMPHTTIIPRMFPNVYAPDNVLLWYQRQVVETPTGAPDTYLRTVSPTWTVTRSLTIPTGLYDVDQLLLLINAATGVNEVWSYDSDYQRIIVTRTPVGPPIIFGTFVDAAWVPPATSFADMTYVAEPLDSHIFSTLGLEVVASTMTSLPLSQTLVLTNADTFDNIIGSNITNRNLLPLFNRISHSYAEWSVDEYATPFGNAPNLAGPVVIHVLVSDIGDSSTVDAETGLVQDIITSVNVGDVDFGTFKERLANDAQADGIQFQQARNISSFRVRLLDSRNRQLTLPRNWPVFLKLHMIHTLD